MVSPVSRNEYIRPAGPKKRKRIMDRIRKADGETITGRQVWDDARRRKP